MLFLLLGCASGVLQFRDGSEPVRSAWYTKPSVDNADLTLVLVSNSDIYCDLPESEDPGEQEAALVRQSAAFSREGTAIVLFLLYLDPALSALGSYEVTGDASPTSLPFAERGAPDLLAAFNGRAAGASWLTIREAAVEEEDGLAVSYEPGSSPGDVIYVPQVQGPGKVTVTGLENDTFAATFQLDVVDVSGRFEAAYCGEDSDLYTSLSLTAGMGR